MTEASEIYGLRKHIEMLESYLSDLVIQGNQNQPIYHETYQTLVSITDELEQKEVCWQDKHGVPLAPLSNPINKIPKPTIKQKTKIKQKPTINFSLLPEDQIETPSLYHEIQEIRQTTYNRQLTANQGQQMTKPHIYHETGCIHSEDVIRHVKEVREYHEKYCLNALE